MLGALKQLRVVSIRSKRACLHSASLQIIVEDNTGVASEIPLLITEGELYPLTDYLLQHVLGFLKLLILNSISLALVSVPKILSARCNDLPVRMKCFWSTG